MRQRILVSRCRISLFYLPEMIYLGRERKMTMRRKEREVVDAAKIEEIIDKCDTCRLGMQDKGGPYIVPMSFGYARVDGVYELYFHSALEGRKIALLKTGNLVGFEMDTSHQLVQGPRACDYTMRYQSVIGTGRPVFLEGEKKMNALERLMAHYASEKLPFSEKWLECIAVFKIVVEQLSCKENLQ